LFTSQTMREVFSPRQTLRHMLAFEAALAMAEGRTGVIPQSAAETIARCCRAELLDFESLTADAVEAGNLAIPLVKQLTMKVREADAQAAGYVHWGATSQDAIDSGMALQLREALVLMNAGVASLSAEVAALTERHRYTLLPGRTLLQHAVPTTFGMKAAGWLDALLRQQQRLAQLKPRVLVLQFGGAAGTLASLGDRGLAVAAALAEELKLELPMISFHTHRDRTVETAAWCGMLTGLLGKMARDLSLLMQTEVGEALEGAAEGRGGSSTMPHKRNPVAAAAVLAAAIRVPGLISTLFAGMVQEHERGLGGWQAEWETVPEIFILTARALERMTALVAGLEVHPERMRANLDLTKGLVMAEAASMALAEKLGLGPAHQLVAEASRRAIAEHRSLRAVLAENPDVSKHLGPEELEALFDPLLHTGAAQQLIDRVLAEYWRTAAEPAQVRP
jgi:3-carboxy-cis,cis-muconate cycloisomerase